MTYTGWEEVSLSELVQCSGLSAGEIRELVDLGVFDPLAARDREWVFTARCVHLARTASRLRNDFELNVAGVALALAYLERIEGLERRVRELECQLPAG